MSILNKYRNSSLKNKLLLSYILIAIIPLTIYSIISAVIMSHQVQSSLILYTSEMIDQVDTSIVSYFDTIENQLDVLSLSINNATNDFELEKLFDNIRIGNNSINSVIYAKNDDSYISSGSTRISRDLLEKENWYQKAINSDAKFEIIAPNESRNFISNNEYSSQEVYSFARKVVDSNNNLMGVLLLDVSQNFIDKSVQKISIGKEGFVFICDENDNIVYSPVNTIVWKIDNQFLNYTDKLMFLNIDNIDYCLQNKKLGSSNWKVCGIFSYSVIVKQLSNNLTLLIYIGVFVLLFSIIASILLSESITRPLKKLQKLMKRTEKGDLSVFFDAKNDDEIGNLGRSFNSMIRQIEQLIDEVYYEQQKKRRAQLRTLEEQIKPHFLYNTLDTIIWLAKEKEAFEVVNLVEALTNMYRIALSKGKSHISIKEELQHVSAYLFIQQTRYSDKMIYSINIDEHFMNYNIPKLILQPLVENSIYHGIKEKRGKGEITISAIETCKTLTIRVADTGAGIKKEKLEEINKLLFENNKTPDSFGIFYVNEKLKLEYGNDFGILISSEEGKYTNVDVLLPIIRSTICEKNQNNNSR